MSSQNKSIAGDPVGLKAIQSIMQTATQSNLSFFHKAGLSSSSIMSLSPSVQQLLDVSTTPTCRMIIYFENEENIEKIKNDMIYHQLFSMIKKIDVIPQLKEDSWYQIGRDLKLFQTHCEEDDIVVRFVFDYNQLRKNNITLSTIVKQIFPYSKDYLTAYSPDILGIIDVIVYETKDIIYVTRLMKEASLGIREFKSMMIQKNKIITEGSNLAKIMTYESVDKLRTISNHIYQVKDILGLEAARSVLYDELLKKTENEYYSHILADFMTRDGTLKPFSKYKNFILDKGPLLSIGLERPTNDIRRTIIDKIIDPLENSYSRIVVGLPPRLGTGYNDINE